MAAAPAEAGAAAVAVEAGAAVAASVEAASAAEVPEAAEAAAGKKPAARQLLRAFYTDSNSLALETDEEKIYHI